MLNLRWDIYILLGNCCCVRQFHSRVLPRLDDNFFRHTNICFLNWPHGYAVRCALNMIINMSLSAVKWSCCFMRLQRGWHLLLRNMPLAHRVITCINMRTAKTVHINYRGSRFLNMSVALRITCMRFYYKCGMLKQIASSLYLSISFLCPNILTLKQMISMCAFIVVHIGVNMTSLMKV